MVAATIAAIVAAVRCNERRSESIGLFNTCNCCSGYAIMTIITTKIIQLLFVTSVITGIIAINVKTELIYKCYRLTHRKQQKLEL